MSEPETIIRNAIRNSLGWTEEAAEEDRFAERFHWSHIGEAIADALAELKSSGYFFCKAIKHEDGRQEYTLPEPILLRKSDTFG